MFSLINYVPGATVADVMLLKCVSFERPSSTVQKGLFLPTPKPWTDLWVYREEVTVAPSWRTHCLWERSGVSCMSSFVIVFSACALRLSMRRYQRVENLISARFTLTSPWCCFPFFRRCRWHIHTKSLLISKNHWQRDRAEEERAGLSDPTCYADVFWNSWCNQTLCCECSCDWNTVIFHIIYHSSLI